MNEVQDAMRMKYKLEMAKKIEKLTGDKERLGNFRQNLELEEAKVYERYRFNTERYIETMEHAIEEFGNPKSKNQAQRKTSAPANDIRSNGGTRIDKPADPDKMATTVIDLHRKLHPLVNRLEEAANTVGMNIKHPNKQNMKNIDALKVLRQQLERGIEILKKPISKDWIISSGKLQDLYDTLVACESFRKKNENYFHNVKPQQTPPLPQRYSDNMMKPELQKRRYDQAFSSSSESSKEVERYRYPEEAKLKVRTDVALQKKSLFEVFDDLTVRIKSQLQEPPPRQIQMRTESDMKADHEMNPSRPPSKRNPLAILKGSIDSVYTFKRSQDMLLLKQRNTKKAQQDERMSEDPLSRKRAKFEMENEPGVPRIPIENSRKQPMNSMVGAPQGLEKRMPASNGQYYSRPSSNDHHRPQTELIQLKMFQQKFIEELKQLEQKMNILYTGESTIDGVSHINVEFTKKDRDHLGSLSVELIPDKCIMYIKGCLFYDDVKREVQNVANNTEYLSVAKVAEIWENVVSRNLAQYIRH